MMVIRPAELRVLRPLWDGLSQREVAGRLGVSERHIHHVVRSLKLRTGVRSTLQLMRTCVKDGVLTP